MLLGMALRYKSNGNLLFGISPSSLKYNSSGTFCEWDKESNPKNVNGNRQTIERDLILFKVLNIKGILKKPAISINKTLGF